MRFRRRASDDGFSFVCRWWPPCVHTRTPGAAAYAARYDGPRKGGPSTIPRSHFSIAPLGFGFRRGCQSRLPGGRGACSRRRRAPRAAPRCVGGAWLRGRLRVGGAPARAGGPRCVVCVASAVCVGVSARAGAAASYGGRAAGGGAAARAEVRQPRLHHAPRQGAARAARRARAAASRARTLSSLPAAAFFFPYGWRARARHSALTPPRARGARRTRPCGARAGPRPAAASQARRTHASAPAFSHARARVCRT
jgi:hypothetical protein